MYLVKSATESGGVVASSSSVLYSHAMMSVHLLFPIVPSSESAAGTNVAAKDAFPVGAQQSRMQQGAVTAKEK
jgi:hypothetical protein